MEKSTNRPQAALPDDELPEDELLLDELDDPPADEEELELPDPAAAGVLLVLDEPFEEDEPASDEDLSEEDFEASELPDEELAVDPAVSDDLPLLRESVR